MASLHSLEHLKSKFQVAALKSVYGEQPCLPQNETHLCLTVPSPVENTLVLSQATLEQFQGKCEAVSRPKLRQNK
jgi:hypothetical protein